MRLAALLLPESDGLLLGLLKAPSHPSVADYQLAGWQEIELKSPKRGHNSSFSPASLVHEHLKVAFNKIKSRKNLFALQLKI